ncbi:MAG: hypothetical protein IJR83_03105 [Clostridia bacterium]|nr:hypothetical protein [Clostridia bacterium]
MWMHNPLMEMRLIRQNPEACRMEGNLREEIGCSVMNSGMFMACLERGDVKGIYFGHDHRNDCSGTVHGIHMGYDGALYDQRRERDLVDNRGGREFVLYEDGRPYTTRMIRLADFNLPVEEKVKMD